MRAGRQPVILLRLKAFRPALKRPRVDPENLRRLHLRQLPRLRPVQQTRKPHPPYSLVNGCRAHRAPFVQGSQNTTLHELQTGDKSRATDIGLPCGCRACWPRLNPDALCGPLAPDSPFDGFFPGIPCIVTAPIPAARSATATSATRFASRAGATASATMAGCCSSTCATITA